MWYSKPTAYVLLSKMTLQLGQGHKNEIKKKVSHMPSLSAN